MIHGHPPPFPSPLLDFHNLPLHCCIFCCCCCCCCCCRCLLTASVTLDYAVPSYQKCSCCRYYPSLSFPHYYPPPFPPPPHYYPLPHPLAYTPTLPATSSYCPARRSAILSQPWHSPPPPPPIFTALPSLQYSSLHSPMD